MTEKTNIEAQQRFGDAVNSGSFGTFAELVDSRCVDHDPAPGQARGAAGYQDFFIELRTAFPDLHLEVEHLTAAGDDVAFAYTVTGTHEGQLMGHAPTGKSIKIRGMQISRFSDGKLIERWGSSDQLGMLQQLGLTA